MYHMFLGLSRHDLESEEHCFPRENSFGATMLWLMRMSMAGSLLLERILRLVQLLLLNRHTFAKEVAIASPQSEYFHHLPNWCNQPLELRSSLVPAVWFSRSRLAEVVAWRRMLAECLCDVWQKELLLSYQNTVSDDQALMPPPYCHSQRVRFRRASDPRYITHAADAARASNLLPLI